MSADSCNFIEVCFLRNKTIVLVQRSSQAMQTLMGEFPEVSCRHISLIFPTSLAGVQRDTAPPKMRYTFVAETEPPEGRIEVKVYFSMLDSSVRTEGLSCAKRLDHLAICKRRTLGKVVVASTGGVRVEDLKVVDGVEDIDATYEESHTPETGSMSSPTASSPELSIRTTDGISVSSQQPQSFGDHGSLPPSMESDPFDGTTSASHFQGSRRP